MNRNWVGHCQQGSSDKVYIVTIEDAPGGGYNVFGKWGKRGKGLTVKVKGHGMSRAAAENAARDLIEEKEKGKSGGTKSRYDDITSPAYSGPYSMADAAPYLVDEDGTSQTTPSTSAGSGVSTSAPKSDPVGANTETGGEFTVVCEDNTGMEEWFDEGVEYFAKGSTNGGTELLEVEDRFGEFRTCLSDRFRAVVNS